MEPRSVIPACARRSTKNSYFAGAPEPETTADLIAHLIGDL